MSVGKIIKNTVNQFVCRVMLHSTQMVLLHGKCYSVRITARGKGDLGLCSASCQGRYHYITRLCGITNKKFEEEEWKEDGQTSGYEED